MTVTPGDFYSPYPAEKRLGSDLALTPEYQAPAFTAPKTGPGRWCVMYAQGGEVVLGVLWTSDAGGLGFIPSTTQGIQRIPEFYKGFSAAKAKRQKASTVFNDWASRASLGLSAGPVVQGDLDTLPE